MKSKKIKQNSLFQGVERGVASTR